MTRKRYVKEKFHEVGFYHELGEYLLARVSKLLKPINYDCWAELYWKKQLEEKLTVKLENENFKIIEGVYSALICDKEIQEQMKRIKGYEWVRVMRMTKNE